MAGGWARDGAVQDQIDDTVSDAVSVTGSPTRAVVLSADAMTDGARLAKISSFERPKPVRPFDVIVFTSISHSGCNQPYAY